MAHRSAGLPPPRRPSPISVRRHSLGHAAVLAPSRWKHHWEFRRSRTRVRRLTAGRSDVRHPSANANNGSLVRLAGPRRSRSTEPAQVHGSDEMAHPSQSLPHGSLLCCYSSDGILRRLILAPGSHYGGRIPCIPDRRHERDNDLLRGIRPGTHGSCAVQRDQWPIPCLFHLGRGVRCVPAGVRLRHQPGWHASLPIYGRSWR